MTSLHFTLETKEIQNLIERLNQEVRHEKVIHIFPNVVLANRLIGAILIDLHEEWISSSRKHVQF